jgi:uncharacterized membrane protein YhaH (DUF805 family)
MVQQTYVKPRLTFSEALNVASKRVTEFTGRSRRSEFWWCYLAVIIANMVAGFIPFVGSVVSLLLSLAIIPIIFRRLHDTGRSGWWWGASVFIGIALCIIAVVAAVPFFKDIVGSPELLDEDEFVIEFFKEIFTSPAFLIGLAVSFIYEIVMLVFLCQDSQVGPNKYGDSPKYTTES